MIPVVVTSVSPAREGVTKLSCLYEFWSHVSTNGFPMNLELGKLDNFGITTQSLITDIIERDIDSRFMVIPKKGAPAIVVNDENGEEKERLQALVNSYLIFRDKHMKEKKQS